MKFYKYYASGNDFIIFNANQKGDKSMLAKTLCNRYEGIGADGMIAILKHDKLDFEWEFYNNDGSKADMCGNGARAAAHFAHHFNHQKENINFLTGAGIIKAQIKNDLVSINLGKIKYIKEPFIFENKPWQECDSGVPHLVHFCDDINQFDIQKAKFLRDKYNANVNYAQIIDKSTIKVRTFERGVENETLACGTGMGACFYLAFLKSLVYNEVKIIPKSNEELIFSFKEDEIFFQGKVRCCFEANYYLL